MDGRCGTDSSHSLYKTWVSMWHRCYNPRRDSYLRYGGRGIRVCESFKDFRIFAKVVGDRPEGFTLDRIDVTGHYTHDNLRWASKKTQSINCRKRPNKTGYVGVVKNASNKYQAKIRIGGKNTSIGSKFKTAFIAAIARDAAVRLYHEGFTDSQLNFPNIHIDLQIILGD